MGLDKKLSEILDRNLWVNEIHEQSIKDIKALFKEVNCNHNWHHIDNHSDRMYCIKCDKNI